MRYDMPWHATNLLAVASVFGSQQQIPGPKAPAALAVFGHHGMLSGPSLPASPVSSMGIASMLPYLLSLSLMVGATADHFMLPASVDPLC